MLPILTALLVVGLVAFYAFGRVMSGFSNRQIMTVHATHKAALEQRFKSKHMEYQSLLNSLQDRALEQAAFFSKTLPVLTAYRLAHEGNPEDEEDAHCREARATLKAYFKDYQKGYSSNTDFEIPFIHFHIAPAQSLARTWRDGWQTSRNGQKVDITDDLSSFRQTVIQVIQTGKFVRGIEVGSGGFVIRGVCPIQDDSGETLGSVESFFDYAPLLSLLKNDEDEDYALFMSADLLDMAEDLRDTTKYPLVGTKYVLCVTTAAKQDTTLVSQEELDQCHGQPVTIENDHSRIMLFPVNDFAGSQIGVLAMIFDTSVFASQVAAAEQESADAIQRVTMLMGIGMLLVIVIISGIIGFTVGRIVADVGRISDTLVNMAGNVGDISTQLSDSSMTLADGATEQAAALEQSSAALEEVASMTRQNAENAQQTNQSMEKVSASVEKGNQSLLHLEKAMSDITASSGEIGKIIKTIEEVAFQTNLLALNAAVEAARAGDAGKGFAVVADEVRNLAQRSAQAARDTANLITSTIERVQVGSRATEEMKGDFAGVFEGLRHAVQRVGEIAASSKEQAQGVDQINTAVSQMDKVTQQNAAGAEEIASSSGELQAQMHELHRSLADLNVIIAGGRRDDDDAANGFIVQDERGSSAVLDNDQPSSERQLQHRRSEDKVLPVQRSLPHHK